jgi:gamma-glutamylcyclotransferase (GGCT)/AIG2-like uncharacterized protein YtfP
MRKSKEMFMNQRENENKDYLDWRQEIIELHCKKLANEFKENNLIFVYGTLQRGHGNHRLIQDQEFVNTATTNDKYILTANGIPFVGKSQQVCQVKGELFRLDSVETMSTVDALESHPLWYRREIIKVTDADGNEQEAWIYFNEDKGMHLIEDGSYTNYTKSKKYY